MSKQWAQFREARFKEREAIEETKRVTEARLHFRQARFRRQTLAAVNNTIFKREEEVRIPASPEYSPAGSSKDYRCNRSLVGTEAHSRSADVENASSDCEIDPLR